MYGQSAVIEFSRVVGCTHLPPAVWMCSPWLYYTVVFICTSLGTSAVEHLLMCVLTIGVYSFMKWLFKTYLYFHWVFFLVLLLDWSSLYSLSPLPDLCTANVFSTLAFLFPLFLASFNERKLLILVLLNLSIYSFVVTTFCLLFKKSLFTPGL